MVWKHLKHPLVAPLGLGEIIPVFVEQAEVDQAAERGGIPLQRTLVAIDGLVVVPEPVVHHP